MDNWNVFELARKSKFMPGQQYTGKAKVFSLISGNWNGINNVTLSDNDEDRPTKSSTKLSSQIVVMEHFENNSQQVCNWLEAVNKFA